VTTVPLTGFQQTIVAGSVICKYDENFRFGSDLRLFAVAAEPERYTSLRIRIATVDDPAEYGQIRTYVPQKKGPRNAGLRLKPERI